MARLQALSRQCKKGMVRIPGRLTFVSLLVSIRFSSGFLNLRLKLRRHALGLTGNAKHFLKRVCVNNL